MHFHEESVDPGAGRRAGQRFYELALAAGLCPAAARQLHAVRCVKHHRIPETAENRERPHVHDQIVIAERRPALSQHDPPVSALLDLFHRVRHFERRQKLSFLHVHDFACLGGGNQQIRLPAEKRRYLQHIDHAAGLGRLRLRVHVGQHRHADLLFHLGQHLEALLQPRPAKRRDRSPIRFVERRLEHIGHAQCSGDFGNATGCFDHQLLAFNDAGTGDQKRTLPLTDGECADVNEMCHGLTRDSGLMKRDKYQRFSLSALMSELLAQGRPDKPAEQRMGTVRTRTIFRMKLCGQEPGMIFQLDDFDQPPIRREPAQHESFCRQLLTVGVVELKAVPMPFTDFVDAIHFVRERPFAQPAEVAPQPHRAALVAYALLILHQVDDWMGRPLVELGAVGAGQVPRRAGRTRWSRIACRDTGPETEPGVPAHTGSW